MKKREVYFSVDIEASGPIPGDYSMLSLGARVVSEAKDFYVEIKPLNDNFIEKALQVAGLSMEKLKVAGVEPAKAMKDFKEWVESNSVEAKPVFVGFNATFDWSFVNYYFHRFLGENPFGVSGLDIKAYYMGMEKCAWQETVKKEVRKKYPATQKHTHNALDDAIEQAQIFEKMLKPLSQ
jgi:DNA polymerase III epsilon subunit-like protein